jgi:xanthine/uracil permease
VRTHRRIIAAMVFVFFADLARHPDDYDSGTYNVLRDVAPLRWWGIALAVLAAVVFATRSLPPLAVMVGGLVAWTAGLVAALFTGDSQSPAGWVFQAGIIALLFWGAGRHPVKPS